MKFSTVETTKIFNTDSTVHLFSGTN